MCAEEQVQFIGRIQSHGLLFALSEPDLIVRQVSANVSAYLGISPQLILGGSFEAILRSQQFESFQYQVLSGEPMGAALLSLAVGSNTIAMHCVYHRHDGVLIVEMEPSTECIPSILSTSTVMSVSHFLEWRRRRISWNCRRSPQARFEDLAASIV
jgi:light-regulated signal transduction histidine kinase (bacteriophytochrome)